MDEERLIMSRFATLADVDKALRPLIDKGYILAGMETDPASDDNVVYILRLISRVKG